LHSGQHARNHLSFSLPYRDHVEILFGFPGCMAALKENLMHPLVAPGKIAPRKKPRNRRR
jgi:hypothetical protein